VDADVLGRQRTGDETYVENLLRALAPLAEGLRLAAVVRRAELAPEGVEPLVLPARVQETRMIWSLPRLLRKVRPALAHFLYAIPPGCPCPAVVTVQDLSFAREPALMGWKDRVLFRWAVPRAARRAARILAISERTKGDLVDLYGVAEDKVVVTPLGVDAAFRPGEAPADSYVLFVGAIQRRKNPLAAAEAARQVGLRLVVVGPEKDRRLAQELRRAGAELRGYLPKSELAAAYRGAACVVLPSRYEGFGLPVVEAMASGTPVVLAPDPALREVAGDAAVYAEPDQLAAAFEHARADRERLAAAGRERAQQFTWTETARRTLAVYRAVLEGR
jgi:glycosyltransferase involved in cell wall biosynthesis